MALPNTRTFAEGNRPIAQDSDLIILMKLLDFFTVNGTVNVAGGAGGSDATAANQIAGNADIAKTVPATTAAAVTPSDSTPLVSRGVWVGGAGDLAVRLEGAPSTTVVFTAVPAGTLLPISVVRVMAATTATNINVLA